MFDYDKWQEIFQTIQRNKLRTVLTVFCIGWGLFLVVALTGAGRSFQNGVTKGFADFARNSGFIWGQRTTISSGGFGPGRRVRFDESDSKFMLSHIKEIKNLAPRNSAGQMLIKNAQDGTFTGTFEVYGDYPAYTKIQAQHCVPGRFINESDIQKERKVAVIGKRVRQVLFQEIEKDEEVIGQYISFNDSNFKIIGITKPSVEREGSDEMVSIYIPFSTFAKTFQTGGRVGWYAFSAIDGANVDSVQANMLTLLKRKKKISQLDEEAIGYFNLEAEFQQIQGLFTGLELFVLFIGSIILVAGIIGITNIMLIIIKERTKEIGIRKALGASPISIISIILQESVFLTIIGGIIGMFTAFLPLFSINKLVISSLIGTPDAPPFGYLQINPDVLLGTSVALILGGIIAGIFPAYRAVSIHPVEAMRKD